MTLQTRFILIYGVGSAFFLIVFAVLVFNRLETSMFNQLQQQFEADAGSEISGLQRNLSQTTERFRFSSEIPIFRSMRFNQLTLNNAALSNDIRHLELYFLELQQNNPEIRAIHYLDPNGFEVLRVEKSSIIQKLKDLSQDREVKNALELGHGEVLVTTVLSGTNKVNELIWWVPVFASLNVSSGVMGFHVSFDSFCNRIVSLGGWETKSISVEDGKGGSHFSTGSVEPYGRSADTKWKVSDTLGLPGLPWKVTISADPASFLADVNKLRWQVFLIILPVIISLSLVTIIFTSRRITGNIRKLVKASELIGSGNLGYRVDVKTNDELGKLSVAFNRMAEKRSLGEAEMARHRDHLEEMVDERTKALKEAQEQLLGKERLATLGKLTSTVSHELRNPLGTILSSLFNIRERLSGKGLGTEKALDRAERSVKRCNNIIEEMLFYTRVRDLNLETIAINEWLNELLDEYEIPGGIVLKREFSAKKETLIDLDKEKFHRCMINVIKNACDSMVEKAGTKDGKSDEIENGQLSVSTSIVDDRLNVKITDSGPGITPDELEKVYEPLYSTKSFGAGLGLSIVKQIMEQHKGGIEIKSGHGEGTTVILWLPVRRDEG